MIEIAEILGPRPTPLWNLVKQVGVHHAVGVLPFGESGGAAPWDYTPLLHMKQRFEDAGLTLAAIESRPPLDRAKRGLEGRDAEIATVCTLIENMGRLGIPVW
jgi:mannonate dehydratase